MSNIIVFRHARVFDGVSGDCAENADVLIEDGTIREVSSNTIHAPSAFDIDIAGRTLMPGLIDTHIHAYASSVDVQKIHLFGDAYRTAHAVRMLGFALDCGFTTVRDIGGGDYSLWKAIEDGLIRSPRFFYAGKMISMTGGHGDHRQLGERIHSDGYCSCGAFNSVCVIADGVDECIKAAREELRRGAHCIKITGSGGTASPTDPVLMSQFREDEIRAIVNETAERGTYTSAHCHPAGAIRRCVDFGVRVIEHGTLIDDDTARFVAERKAFVVPTMAVIAALTELGKTIGFPPKSQAKMDFISREAMSGLQSMRKEGVKVGFGTDLLGETYTQQCREFTIRQDVFSPLEILRQATSINAEILQQQGVLGCVAPGAHADLLVVDGDPLKHINLLAENGRHLRLIMLGGKIIRNDLS